AHAYRSRFDPCESPKTEVPASFLAEDQGPVARVRLDVVAVGELAVEQPNRQLILDLLLDQALQGTRPVRGIEASVCQEFPRLVGQRQRDGPLGQPLLQAPQLDIDDRSEVILRQPM